MSGPSNLVRATPTKGSALKYDDLKLTINERWALKNRLGRGTFGIVERGVDTETDAPVAVKIESYQCEPEERKKSILMKEYEVLQEICHGLPNGDTIGFPRPIYFGSCDYMRVMVMELLGTTAMRRFSTYRPSIPEIYNVGIQVLNRLEHIHNCGFLHLDVKMDNILFGRNERKNYVYLADFGLSERYRQSDGTHRPNLFRHHPTGTNNYNSINMAECQTPSRRDDIETLGHVLICLYFWTLPWISPSQWHLRHVARPPQRTFILDTDNSEVLNEEFPPSMNTGNIEYLSKVDYPLKKLCRGMPGMEEFMRYARGLQYEVKPDYKYLRSILRRKMGYNSFGASLTEIL